jgi:U32 family peptidase
LIHDLTLPQCTRIVLTMNASRTPRVLTKPELMSPAGGLPQLRAAIEAGADAVYFGLEGFNARAKAMSFTQATLPDVMGELHERGVMGFVAVNTLVFDTELAKLEDEILGIAAAGADAIIVQDLGVVKLARKLAPGLPVHASTQMTITSAEGAELARELGARRVVLARELSIKDIQMIRAATDVELEVFVHGALCAGVQVAIRFDGGRREARTWAVSLSIVATGFVCAASDSRFDSPGRLFQDRRPL